MGGEEDQSWSHDPGCIWTDRVWCERDSEREREERGQGRVKKRGRRKGREAAWGESQERSDFRRDRRGEEREPEARGAGTFRVMCATKRGSAKTADDSRG